MKYVLKYKKREIDLSGVELPPEHKFADVSMDDIGKKIKGHGAPHSGTAGSEHDEAATDCEYL